MNEELMKVVAEMRLAALVERKRQYGEDRAITELDCDDWADRLEALAATTRGTEVPEEVFVPLIGTMTKRQHIERLGYVAGWNACRSKMLGGGA